MSGYSLIFSSAKLVCTAARVAAGLVPCLHICTRHQARRETSMAEPFRTIRTETIEPSIARITLNRPKHMNAYTNPICDEIAAAPHQYVEDDAVRCVIVTGAGRGVCSAGD